MPPCFSKWIPFIFVAILESGRAWGEREAKAHLAKALEANFQLTCNWSLGSWFSPSQRSIIASGWKIF